MSFSPLVVSLPIADHEVAGRGHSERLLGVSGDPDGHLWTVTSE